MMMMMKKRMRSKMSIFSSKFLALFVKALQVYNGV